MKSTVAFQAECSEDTVQRLATDLQNVGQTSDLSDTLKSIDAVQPSDVQKVSLALRCY